MRGTMSKREENKFQDYLLVLLYSHYPLRNNFGDVKIITPTDFKKLTKEAREAHNYLIKRIKHKYSLALIAVECFFCIRWPSLVFVGLCCCWVLVLLAILCAVVRVIL